MDSPNAYYVTAETLCRGGFESIPNELISSKHLIYSSPATLSFNSPGANGFGVKRAGLTIPNSVMLLVAPTCCGRNTSTLSGLNGYADRFFYLLMDEVDIVTGKHLNRVSEAVKEVCDSLQYTPSVVMVCITCVDALLGTDMERVCKKASEYANVPVLPCYMYALTREGRQPPMVAVRKTIYSLLEPMPKRGDVVNLLGYFSPLRDDCELYSLLHSIGVKTVHEVSRCNTFEEYLSMAEANFNLVLNPESRLASDDFHKRLNIPSIELTRTYQLEKVKKQYALLGATLGVSFDDTKYYLKAKQSIDEYINRYPNTTFAIGETLNADTFELALALLRYGLNVLEVYGTITAENYIYVKKIAEINPNVRVYSNLSPTMLYYNIGELDVDVTIGKDAEYYHPNTINIPWNEEVQPFGYMGITTLFKELLLSMQRTEV